MKTRLAFLCIVLAAPAYAGGWSSSGGELLESAINPWFVQAGGAQQKQIVRYCVESDEQNFGVERRQLSEHVREAFRYWFDEFTSAAIPDNGVGNRVHVARESFFEAPCSEDIALRFQFGVLSSEQIEGFRTHGQDPRKLVAVAIRTDYDERTLKGRGFIYIAPPRGPLAMLGRALQEDPWAESTRLRGVLRHELGHVFGLQHGGTDTDLMGAGFPEHAVSAAVRYLQEIPGVFKVPMGVVLGLKCSGFPGFEQSKRFFHVPDQITCIAMRLYQDRFDIVGWPPNDQDHEILIGRGSLHPIAVTTKMPLVRLWLPTGQQLFPPGPSFKGDVLTGPTALRHQRTGTYWSVDRQGELRAIAIQVAPDRVQIDGVVNGQISLDLLHFPFTL